MLDREPSDKTKTSTDKSLREFFTSLTVGNTKLTPIPEKAASPGDEIPPVSAAHVSTTVKEEKKTEVLDNLVALRKIHDIVHNNAGIDPPSQHEIENLKQAPLDSEVWKLLRAGIIHPLGQPSKLTEYSKKLKEYGAYKALFCRSSLNLSAANNHTYLWYRNIIENSLYLSVVKKMAPGIRFNYDPLINKSMLDIIDMVDNEAITTPASLSPRQNKV